MIIWHYGFYRSGWTIYVLIGPFMLWHKWSGRTNYVEHKWSPWTTYARTIYAVGGLTINYGLLWCPCLHYGASLDSFSQAVATSHPPLTLTSHPFTPLAALAQKWCAPSKNNLKWPKIKQLTNSIDQ